MNRARTYIAIDLKSFYASVECVERNFDPLTTNLVVADASRTDKTICLAVTPSLKALGISGRARLFEVIRKVKEINRERLSKAVKGGYLQRSPADGRYHFTTTSFDAEALAEDPSLELSYYTAPPRMKLYEEYSTRIFSIYMKYIAPEDIHVYSIDECFMDVTDYLETYHLTAHELTMTMIRDVLYTTGITATAGIGSNLYLSKIAMDIQAKHIPPDKDGVRVAELDEQSYREKLWCHQPLTDFWRVGRGTARRLADLGCFTMGDVARLSIKDDELLYHALGINAELLIDHAWGREPVTIKHIKQYRPSSFSLSSGQVLKEPYPFEKGRLIVREMAESLALDLVRKKAVTRKIELTIGYDRTSLKVQQPGKSIKDTVYAVTKTGKIYTGKVTADSYGRAHPGHARGTGSLSHWTSSTRRITETILDVYERVVDPDLLIRRISIAVLNLIPENRIPDEEPVQLDMFTDYEALEKQRIKEKSEEAREHNLQKTALQIQKRYGKNALLKGMNYLEGGTAIERNRQIGGHRSGDE